VKRKILGTVLIFLVLGIVFPFNLYGETQLDAKFKGIVIGRTIGGGYDYYTIKIQEILEDPTGVLKIGDKVFLQVIPDFPGEYTIAELESIVEVYGVYTGSNEKALRYTKRKLSLPKNSKFSVSRTRRT